MQTIERNEMWMKFEWNVQEICIKCEGNLRDQSANFNEKLMQILNKKWLNCEYNVNKIWLKFEWNVKEIWINSQQILMKNECKYMKEMKNNWNENE